MNLHIQWSVVQAVPLSARKAEGIAPFLQLPHFNDDIVKKITRKVRYLAASFLIIFSMLDLCQLVVLAGELEV